MLTTAAETHILNIGEYINSFSDYAKALELNPENDKVFDNRGFAYFKTKSFYQAIDDYNKAILLNPNNKNAYKNRADAFEKIGEKAKAQLDREKAKALETQ